jgi:hypothetical protein
MIKSQTFRLLRIGYRLVPDLSRYWPVPCWPVTIAVQDDRRQPAVPAGHNPNTDPQPPTAESAASSRRCLGKIEGWSSEPMP